MVAQTLSDAGLELESLAIEALRPPPSLTVSQWAERYRVLPEDEAEPGPWRNSRTPYLIEIMDRLSTSDPCEEIVFMKGSQIGGTEVLLNALGFWIEHSPGRILSVLPGEDEASDFSRQRLGPLIENTPVLKARVAEKGGKFGSNNVFLKEFPGGSLKLTGANSAPGLRSKPIRYLLADEIDGYTLDAGGEGDPLYLAEKRMGTYANRKRFLNSTPNIKQTSRIEPRYLGGDQRRYYVPCPHCGEKQILEWENFVIPEDEAGVKQPNGAFMCCSLNGCVIENHDKDSMLPAGEWRATAPYNGWRRSYHLSSLYSPNGWLSWAHIADEWLRVQGDPISLKTFFNTVLGQTWDIEGGETINDGELLARRETYPEAGAPAPVLVVTGGVDVQGDRLELELCGWADKEESYSLSYVVIPGDPTGEEIWEDLWAILDKPIRVADGRKLRVAATCVDSSYEAHKVYAFSKRHWKRRVWAIKGKSGQDREIWPLTWNRNRNKDAKFKLVGVDQAKRNVYARLAKRERGAGYCHFPADRPAWYFEQLTAERMVTKYSRGHKRIEFVLPPGKRNEPLDCRAYAYAALCGLVSMGLVLEDKEASRDKEAILSAKSSIDSGKQKPQANRAGLAPKEASGWIPKRDW